jgi:hypothetical protein
MSPETAGPGSEDPRVEVIDADSGPPLPIVERGGRAQAIIWPGMGAKLRSLHRISLEPGGWMVELSHLSEAVYYVLSGSGAVREGSSGPLEPILEGSMVHVDAGTPYVLGASADGMELVGGPAPADPALYGSLEAMA